jgi:hypothetical protein
MKKFIPALLTGLLSTLVVSQSAYAGSATVLGGLVNTSAPTQAQTQAAQAAFPTPPGQAPTAPTTEQIVAVQAATVLQNSVPALANTTPQTVLSSAQNAASAALAVTGTNALTSQFAITPQVVQQAAQGAQSFFGVLNPSTAQIQAVLNVQNLLSPPGATAPLLTTAQTQTLLSNLGVNINSNATVTIPSPPALGSPAAIAANNVLTNLFGINTASSTAVTTALINLANLFRTPTVSPSN